MLCKVTHYTGGCISAKTRSDGVEMYSPSSSQQADILVNYLNCYSLCVVRLSSPKSYVLQLVASALVSAM